MSRPAAQPSVQERSCASPAVGQAGPGEIKTRLPRQLLLNRVHLASCHLDRQRPPTKLVQRLCASPETASDVANFRR